jgi:hypothetical protein
VLVFDDGTKLALNRTNVKTLIGAFGRDSDAWLGRDVELYGGQTHYQGKAFDSVLVRAAGGAK